MRASERAKLLHSIKYMSHEDMLKTLALLDELDARKRQNLAQNDFLAFIAAVDGAYKFGTHLKRLGALLMEVEDGHKDRIAVSMAPRFGKSLMISVYYPAWYLGRHPDHKLIVASHTVDLAVDMARKVRNLMQTPEYKSIFPGVNIAADAKAAGKWNTTKGGEVYATGVGGALAGRGAHLCIAPTTKVFTLERGKVDAVSVVVGEHLRSWHGWTRVRAKVLSKHKATVTLGGRLRASKEHPIWTLNRGWVPAEKVVPSDVLWTMTWFDTVKAHLQGVFYGKANARAIPHADVQHLGADAAAMHESESGQLHILRRGWDYCMRAVAGFRKFLCGYGASADCAAHVGQGRQQQGVFAGELPVGRRGDSAKQPHQCGVGVGFWGEVVSSTMGQKDRAYQGHDLASHFHASDVAGRSPSNSENEPQQAAYTPVPTGWLRCAGVWVLSRCSQSAWGLGVRENEERFVERTQAREWASRVFELLLGVRYAGVVTLENHGSRAFVNFMVSGDHTFVGDNVLSHNCIIDDPISEQDIKLGGTSQLDTIYEWFRSGLRTRLMPGGRLAILHTRWHQRDLIGRLLKDGAMNPDGDVYEMFEFPAILESENPLSDPEHPEFDPEAPKTLQKSLWPEQWSLESLLRTKASMPSWQWNAQYQQNPTAQEAAIIKRDHIKWWTKETPPVCDFIVQAYDTALTTKERSDYSVCQTWGVWTDDNGVENAILLNRVKGKWEFPELKKMAHEQYEEWEPDSVIVEAKASGQPLIDEMRRSGLFVQDFSPGKGQDKIARLNAVSDMFASGQVWFPETWWASEVVEEILAFPAGEHDDDVDTMTLALRRVRQGGLLRLNSDKLDLEDRVSLPRRQAYY